MGGLGVGGLAVVLVRGERRRGVLGFDDFRSHPPLTHRKNIDFGTDF